MTADIYPRLSSVPALLLPQLRAPQGAVRVDLHRNAAKTFRLGETGKKLTSDGTLAFERDDKLICVALQAEHRTGKNMSALLGKALLPTLVGGHGDYVGNSG